MDETEVGTAAPRARAEAGGERGRGGRSQRGRGRGTSSRGRGRNSTVISETTEGGGERASEVARMPDLWWEINVQDQTGAQAIVDIPRLLCPEMNLPAQVKFDSTICNSTLML